VLPKIYKVTLQDPPALSHIVRPLRKSFRWQPRGAVIWVTRI